VPAPSFQAFLDRDLCSVTVDKLKALITELNDPSYGLHLRKTGRKQELVDA
jgi:hypothetical protein